MSLPPIPVICQQQPARFNAVGATNELLYPINLVRPMIPPPEGGIPHCKKETKIIRYLAKIALKFFALDYLSFRSSQILYTIALVCCKPTLGQSTLSQAHIQFNLSFNSGIASFQDIQAPPSSLVWLNNSRIDGSAFGREFETHYGTPLGITFAATLSHPNLLASFLEFEFFNIGALTGNADTASAKYRRTQVTVAFSLIDRYQLWFPISLRPLLTWRSSTFKNSTSIHEIRSFFPGIFTNIQYSNRVGFELSYQQGLFPTLHYTNESSSRYLRSAQIYLFDWGAAVNVGMWEGAFFKAAYSQESVMLKIPNESYERLGLLPFPTSQSHKTYPIVTKLLKIVVGKQI